MASLINTTGDKLPNENMIAVLIKNEQICMYINIILYYYLNILVHMNKVELLQYNVVTIVILII